MHPNQPKDTIYDEREEGDAERPSTMRISHEVLRTSRMRICSHNSKVVYQISVSARLPLQPIGRSRSSATFSFVLAAHVYGGRFSRRQYDLRMMAIIGGWGVDCEPFGGC